MKVSLGKGVILFLKPLCVSAQTSEFLRKFVGLSHFSGRHQYVTLVIPIIMILCMYA